MTLKVNGKFLSTYGSRKKRFVIVPPEKEHMSGVTIKDRVTGQRIRRADDERCAERYANSLVAYKYLEKVVLGCTPCDPDISILGRFVLIHISGMKYLIMVDQHKSVGTRASALGYDERTKNVCYLFYSPDGVIEDKYRTVYRFKDSDEAYAWLKVKLEEGEIT